MAAYRNNLGFAEIMAIRMKGTPEQEARLDEICERNDWEAFKALAKEVLNVELM